MKIVKTAAAIAAMITFATAAQAQDVMAYVGPSIEATASFGDTSRTLQYGAAVGVNGAIGKNVIAGVDVSVEDVFNDDRKFGVGARLGTVLNGTLFYGRVGYANYRQAIDLVEGSKNYDGLQLGAGFERQVSGPLFIRGEYRYTNLNTIGDTHTGLVGVGIRF